MRPEGFMRDCAAAGVAPGRAGSGTESGIPHKGVASLNISQRPLGSAPVRVDLSRRPEYRVFQP
jgi:hypothetical protein